MNPDNVNEETVIEGEEVIENEEGIKDTVVEEVPDELPELPVEEAPVEEVPVKEVKEEKVPSFL